MLQIGLLNSYFNQNIYNLMNTPQGQLGQGKNINLTLLKQFLSEDKKLPRNWLKELIEHFINVNKNQPNVVFIEEPVIVIGDIHGQFFDLLKIISLFPSLQTEPKEHMLFLGDYVDRGPMGVEVLVLLMALKLKYPKKVIMLRGNHETMQMTQTMNFYDEVCDKYDQSFYYLIVHAFNSLPIVCIVNESYFCVHGGITTLAESIPELNKINRFVEVPMSGSLCDLVWSDPVQDDAGSTHSHNGFIANHQRNCSIFFGSDHARSFLKKEKLITIIRAHEVQLEGYKQHFWPKWKDIPMVYTLFSAPNYCGSYGNLGAILTIDKSQFNIRQYKETNPKYYLPARYNAFNFSLPHMFGFLDQIMKRMAKREISIKMPELKHLDTEKAIAIYLKSQHCKQLEHKKEKREKEIASSTITKTELKERSQKQAFKQSKLYFSQSERRPEELPKTKSK